MSDWISVKDRLPEPNQPFWAHRNGYTSPITIMLSGAGLPSDYFAHRNEISHWMPATLPEPPKSEVEQAWGKHSLRGDHPPMSSQMEVAKYNFLAGWQAHEKRGGG